MRISEASFAILNKLEADFSVLQYAENVHKLVASHFDKINRSKSSVRDLLLVVRDEIIVELDNYVIKLHKEVLAKQRKALKQFCDSKCVNM